MAWAKANKVLRTTPFCGKTIQRVNMTRQFLLVFAAAALLGASINLAAQTSSTVEAATPKKMTGIVRRPDGQPAAGLRVEIMAGLVARPEEIKTDAAGRFETKWNQSETTACILIRDTEHNLAVAQDIDDDTGPLDLKLAPALTLAGLVEAGGKPVTNASTTLIFWIGQNGRHLPGANGGTNTPGRFEITALPPGRKYGVIASAPGFGQASTVNEFAEAGRVELDPFELKPASLKLAGQVLDEDDKPVAGVEVKLFGDGQPNDEVARSDQEGRFHFEQVCEGRAQVVIHQRNSSVSVWAEGGDTNVVLQFGQNNMNDPGAQAHKLKGTVTDAEGRPAADAWVAVFSFNGSPHWVKAATNGAFRLNWSLQPWQRQAGGVRLLARDLSRNESIIAEIDEDTTNLEVHLKPALTLTGLVRSQDGSALAGAQVRVMIKIDNQYGSLSDQPAAGDAQGRYQIKCLPPEASYTVIASARGYGQSQRQFEGNSETDDMELAPFVLKLADRVLAGQVLDEDEKPVAGVTISINGDNQPSVNTKTDSKGRFHFQVCEGQVRLFANPPQGGAFAQTSAEAGETNVVLQFGQNNMSSPGSKPNKLTGTVTDADGKPAAGALLAVFPANGSQHWVKPATNGVFKLTWSLQPWQRQSGGAWLVALDQALDQGAVEELDEDNTNLDVKLKPALTVTGMVKSDGGSALPGARVGVQIKTGNNYEPLNERSAVCDAQGRYQIKCLPPEASYVLFASARGYGQGRQQLPVDSQTNRVALSPFVLKLADRVLAGQVLDADDKPVAAANVSITGEGQPSARVNADSKGRFHFQVCEGQIRLFANPPQGGPSAQTSAEAGETNVVLRFGQNNNNIPGAKVHKIKGRVTDADDNPVNGALVAVFPSNGAQHWAKSASNGVFSLAWSLQPWQQMPEGGVWLVVRDPALDQGAAEELQEETTNLNVKLKPALT